MPALPVMMWYALLTLAAATTGRAQAPHLTQPQQGGMPGLPVVTEILPQEGDEMEIRWTGPSGYYQLRQKEALTESDWQVVVPWTTNDAATVSATDGHAFFRVEGPDSRYIGSTACRACHSDVHQSEMDTRHANALITLKQIHQDTNSSCLPCHTVGYGLPTGFISEQSTPQLAGVQCENCHGPAERHVSNPDIAAFRPRIEPAGQMCGGCHTGSHHPTYDEWVMSGHSTVVRNLNGGFIDRCGRCHSGTSRLALLHGEDPSETVEGDANIGIACVVCHDPHAETGFGHQLRNPLFSTNDYSLTTSTDEGEGFLDQYDPEVHLCAQCHNQRGARWDDTGRMAPHHSPQYNMLLGTAGVLPAGQPGQPATHAGMWSITNDLGKAISVTNQCVTCHMQTRAHENGPPEVAAHTGHSFSVDSYGACLDCHQPLVDPELGEERVGQFVDFLGMVVTMEILETLSLLEEWALYHSPPELASYGALAWEYQRSGDLSEGNGPPQGAAGQDLIPDGIKQARFNLYMVQYDGSLGVHNGPHALKLLRHAQNLVWDEIEAVELTPSVLPVE